MDLCDAYHISYHRKVLGLPSWYCKNSVDFVGNNCMMCCHPFMVKRKYSLSLTLNEGLRLQITASLYLKNSTSQNAIQIMICVTVVSGHSGRLCLHPDQYHVLHTTFHQHQLQRWIKFTRDSKTEETFDSLSNFFFINFISIKK